jgi:hypothetical protein
MKQAKKYGNDSISTELDTFLRTKVMYETPSKEWLKETKSEIVKIVNAHFPKKTHQTFIEVYVVGNEFYCLIGFRPLENKKFGFINCNVHTENQK